jgi:3-oxoacyl-[acyl-carrier-protein] synthase III
MLQMNTIINSLGIYLPPKVVSTAELVNGCKTKLQFPLERLTGIKSRRVAGETEFSIDLAKKAIAACLAQSNYRPEDIDLLICCNISRCNGPLRFAFEPSTSIQLKHHLGFTRAVVFDIGSACTGTFTAISIVDAYLKAQMIRCGMVVSGECISHLAHTAQKEIEGFMDPRMACLTVGDAGMAMILETAPDNTVGFHEIEMFTMGRYSSYCIGKATNKEHGGAIMFTDSLKLTDSAVKQGARHALGMLRQAGWPPESFQHLIMHQTSTTSLTNAIREINSLFNKKVCHEGNTINNLSERGNTATNTHFVALMDNILNHRINSGDKVIFGITGSGQTIGTALYTLDDLPDRCRRTNLDDPSSQAVASAQRFPLPPLRHATRIRVESIGTIPSECPIEKDTIKLLKVAANQCLDASSYNRVDIDLVIYAGVYRTDFICEPAIASLLAGDLDINAVLDSPEDKKTFAFDIFNGALGVLNACHVAIQMIRAKKFRTAMIVASEVENNAESSPESLLGLQETGSAFILAEDAGGRVGFGNFLFRYFTQHLDAFRSQLAWKDGKAFLDFHKSPDLDAWDLEAIPPVVDELLSLEELNISQIKMIFPPQISPAFIGTLSQKMGIAEDKFINTVSDGKNLYTSSLAYALRYAREHNLVTSGDIGLIIGVGSGVQVGCVLYYF